MRGRHEHFERLHASSIDPWRVRTRWYERRKRALTLGALNRERYARALDLGCSIGVLSEALADRCRFLECWDPSIEALSRARETLALHPCVRVRRRALPAAVPEAAYELVVLSEVGYYLQPDDLIESARSLRSALAPGGELLACHYRGELADGELAGDEVHRILGTELGLPSTTRVLDADFVIDVWRAPGCEAASAASG